MNISVNTVDNISTFSIEGRIDTLTAPGGTCQRQGDL